MIRIAAKLAFFAAAGGLLLAGTVVEARSHLSGQEQLARLLEGRVAGEPVNCIALPRVTSSTVIDKTAIVYDSGSTRYVQQPKSGAEALDSNDILITQVPGVQLCSIDVVQLRDRNGHFWRGFVGLDKFVPYRRPRKVAMAD